MITSAVGIPIPGIEQINSRVARNGTIASSIRRVRVSIAVVCWSISLQCRSTMKAWCSVNRPVRAWVNAGIFTRNCRTDRSASAAASRCPATIAARIARPDTPVMSVATTDSLIPASSRTFSKRWASRVRARVIAVLVRVRSRSSRIGSGGTNEARNNPCAANWASQAASDTSVLRPGRFFAS